MKSVVYRQHESSKAVSSNGWIPWNIHYEYLHAANSIVGFEARNKIKHDNVNRAETL
jgi:hypothetical protein